MPNRLCQAASPYLLQHACNPVAWEPWDDAALARARTEDKPIFLSIGYAACHWCHVMEQESFEDEEVAAFLNRHFVAIKVDREERPDLDGIYMDAAVALTGRGGWPLSAWLTPEGIPFYAGTYFPPEPRWGTPGFRQVLERIAALWEGDRSSLRKQGRRLRADLNRMSALVPDPDLPGLEAGATALDHLRRTHDRAWGGFGPPPKFPPHLAIPLLLGRGTPSDRTMALRTLDAMADGGIRDHLGGGFARYSVDGRWLVPHFEKMLPDQALLAMAYLEAFQVAKTPSHAEAARGILDYLLRDMRDPAGGFHSSEDADSDGGEGRFYTWTREELRQVLGPEDGDLMAAAYGVEAPGHLEDGRSVLHRFSAPEDLASVHGLVEAELEARLTAMCSRLLEFRNRRPRPGRDDKVLAVWNGLAVRALVKGFEVLGAPRYLEGARACADFLKRELWREGTLHRAWRRGVAYTPSFLEDHAAVALGALDLHEATFDPGWLAWSQELVIAMRTRFEDSVDGGFYDVEADRPHLIDRPKRGFDGASPSGNTLAAEALLRLGWHTGNPDLIHSARRLLMAFGTSLRQRPGAALGMLEMLILCQQGAVEIHLAGEPEDPGVQALLRVMRSHLLPGRVLKREAGHLAGVRICFRGTCSASLTDAEVLEAYLHSLSREFLLVDR